MQGDFEVLVTVTGELQAKNSENIVGPDLQSGVFRFGEFKIQDLVPEGTIVRAGDYVAEIDRSSASNLLLDMEERIERSEARCLTVSLDTTMTLKSLRDDLLNKTFAVEEAEIKVKLSEFEPPATIRQAEIDLDTAKRALEQAYHNYSLREQQMKNNELLLYRANTAPSILAMLFLIFNTAQAIFTLNAVDASATGIRIMEIILLNIFISFLVFIAAAEIKRYNISWSWAALGIGIFQLLRYFLIPSRTFIESSSRETSFMIISILLLAAGIVLVTASVWSLIKCKRYSMAKKELECHTSA
jgi:NADH:ubiquinone oxidoreductase subunit 3 (subunit A)